jgi:hypothetical protein
MADDASDGSTRDSGKDSYNSSWKSRLADFSGGSRHPKRSTSFLPTISKPSGPRPIAPHIGFICPGCKPTGTSFHSKPTCYPSTYSVTTRPYDGPNTCLRVASTRDDKYGGPHSGKTRETTVRTVHNCSDTYSPARVRFPHPLQTLKMTSSIFWPNR